MEGPTTASVPPVRFAPESEIENEGLENVFGWLVDELPDKE